MKVYYDPLDIACKSVTGAISNEETLKLKIKLSGAKTCHLILRCDNGEETSYKMRRCKEGFFVVIKTLQKGLYWYHFVADGIKIGKNWFGFGEIGNHTDNFQLLVYSHGQTYPKSFCGGIMYQIMPDRFCKAQGFGDSTGKKMRGDWGGTPEYKPVNGKILNNDFFGGNFEGIRSKLSYLKKLGVTRIYLNPIFEAKSNHRYDTGDYMKFDRLLGTDQDFINLIKSGKQKDIEFIIDGVFNHTGDDSVYFNKYGNYQSIGAYNSVNSPYYSWFTFQNHPEEYTSWWGIDILPTINKNSSEYEEFITGENGVLDRCLKMGINGVRLDVVDEIPDSFVKKINQRVKKYGDDKIVIGEVWEDATNKIAYGVRRKYFQGNELDSVMNYPLKNAIIEYILTGKAHQLYKVIREQIDNYPAHSLNCMMNILGTHDTPRILTVLGKSGNIKSKREDMEFETLSDYEYELGKKGLKCASLLQYTLYGVPCIYYGDEIGMQGNKDPFNRRCYDWVGGDKELLDWYKFLSKLRKMPVFKEGKVTNVSMQDGVILFTRESENSSISVAVNCGDRVFDISTKGYKNELIRNIKATKIPLNKYDFAIFINE